MTIIGFIIGTILGSFIKAIADRSLNSKTFLGRSYCPKCKHKLGFFDLFPIFSFLFLQGKCRYCGRVISKEYILVEVVMGFLVAFLFWQSSQNYTLYPTSEGEVSLPYTLFFITVLAIIFITDYKKYFIPDRVMLPSIIIAAILSSSGLIGGSRTAEPIIAGLLIGGFFWLLVIFTRGKGMGGGDVKLGVFMGLGLGLINGILAVALAFLIGAVWGVGAIILGRKKLKSHLPFGPFLVIGSLIAMFFGNEIMKWYLNLAL